MENLFKIFEDSVNYWFLYLIGGIIFVAVGIYIFFAPIPSYDALALIFGITVLFTGILELVFALFNRKTMKNWGWHLAASIFGVLFGWVMLVNPEISLNVLPFILGFYFLFKSIMGIGTALDQKNLGNKKWRVSMTLAIVGMLFALVLFFDPMFAGLSAISWVGLALITLGLMGIYNSWEFRKINQNSNRISEDLRKRIEVLSQDIEEELSQLDN